jgi:cytochrome c oxidase assembly protein Cox11
MNANCANYIKTKQIIILFLSAILLGFMMIFPFNLICNLSNKCDPIILSYYFPETKGTQYFEIFFDAKNSLETIDFQSLERSAIVVNGEKFSVNFTIKNNSNEKIKVRPKLYIEPPEAKKYIKFYQCLCFREYKLSPGKQVRSTVKLQIDRKIENDIFFKNNNRHIIIGYKT